MRTRHHLSFALALTLGCSASNPATTPSPTADAAAEVLTTNDGGADLTASPADLGPTSDPGVAADHGAETTVAPSLLDSDPPAHAPWTTACDVTPPDKASFPADAKHFSLAIFHFNIQYVAGGLDDYFGQTVSAEAMEDAIVIESFEPLVALYEKHPTWGASFEMQGYMLEVMAERHPKVLRRFAALVKRGQVDLMTYHWSDQLVVAHPRQDMQWSWQQNARTVEALCIPRVPVYFLQEGQFGPGVQTFAKDMEDGVVMLPRGLAGYWHGARTPALLYDNDGLLALTTDGMTADGLTVEWSFVDDGELLATHKANPYLFDVFKYDATYLKTEYEDKLTALEAKGVSMAPVSHYLAILRERVKAKTLTPAPLVPPVLDGTWHPDDSGNMALWMGGKGQSPGDERDNAVLTQCVRARQTLTAAEVLVRKLEAQGHASAKRARSWHDWAVRELLLAEVSDATGWRPVKTEVVYGLTHGKNALDTGLALGKALLGVLGQSLPATVDPSTQAIAAGGVSTSAGSPLPDAPPGLGTVQVVSDRPSTTAWTNHGDWVELAVTFPATDKTAVGPESPPPVRVSVPLTTDNIIYSPGVGESSVKSYSRSATQAAKDQKTKKSLVIGMPLCNGLLGIGPKWTLVLDQRTVHLAARITATDVSFVDETLPPNESATWRLRFYPKAASEVLGAANRLNVSPPITFE